MTKSEIRQRLQYLQFACWTDSEWDAITGKVLQLIREAVEEEIKLCLPEKPWFGDISEVDKEDEIYANAYNDCRSQILTKLKERKTI